LAVLAGASAAAQSSVIQTTVPPLTKHTETPLTLTGCVVQGERDSYLINNMTVAGAGASSAPAGAYYRFDTNKGFKEHVNHKVEIAGTADFEDVDKGTVTTKTNSAGETTTSVNSERRTVTAPTPEAVGTAGTADSTVKVKVNTYKFHISAIRMLSSTCS
jgi:hypothetical protein